MKFHGTKLLAASCAAAAALALPVWSLAQEQAPQGGGSAAQGSGQGTSDARDSGGATSSGRATQGGSGTTQGRRGAAADSSSPDRGTSSVDRADDRATPPSQTDRRQPTRTDNDSPQRDGVDADRRTTNRIDTGRDDDDRPQGATRDHDDDDASDRDADRFDRGDRATPRTDDDDRDSQVDVGARFTTDSSKRLVVRDLQSRGIFGRAGVRDGDVIISVNGQRVTSWPFMHRIFLAADGRVPIILWRDGVQRTIYIDDYAVETRRRPTYGYDDELYQTDRAWLGVFLDTRYDNAVVVQAVQEGSAADDAGIRAGDRIMSINGRRVQTPSQLTQVIGSMEPGDRVEIAVARWQTRQVDAQLGERPATSSRFRYLEEEGEPLPERESDRDDADRNADEVRETFRVQP